MTAFSLTRLIERVLDQEQTADVDLLTKATIELLTTKQREDALRELLPRFIMNVSANYSRQAARSSGTPKSRWADASKVYKAIVSHIVALDASGENRKMLGDCTAEDCDVLASIRESIAISTMRESKRYLTLAAALRAKDASTVADLDEVTLIEVMRGTTEVAA